MSFNEILLEKPLGKWSGIKPETLLLVGSQVVIEEALFYSKVKML